MGDDLAWGMIYFVTPGGESSLIAVMPAAAGSQGGRYAVRGELRIYDFREFLHLYGGPLGKMASTPSAHGNRRASQFPTVKLAVLLSELLCCSFVC